MEIKPFSEINSYTKEKLAQSDAYQSEFFSFIKIFQHALSYALVQDDKKLIKNYLQLPEFLQHFIYSIKGKMHKPIKASYTFQETVIIDPVRLVRESDNSYKSIYFDKINNSLKQVTRIIKRRDDRLPGDYVLSEFSRHFGGLETLEKKMLHEVILVSKKAAASKSFTETEKKHIHSALHIFFEDYRFYHHLFKNTPTKRVIFIIHYHNEGMIAALRDLGIKCIELQHGLIARHDLYYVYDSAFRSSLRNGFFPDKILVYGDYWKKILLGGCEFQPNEIEVAGDYLYRPTLTDVSVNKKENIILICSQKTLHEEYIRYAKMLVPYLEQHRDWRVIIKLHPLESKKEEYEILKPMGFEIIDLEIPLDKLLQMSKIQISIYSTTFYDAIGFQVVNFALQNYGTSSDYAADMILEGVAEPLQITEDPIALFLEKESRGLSFMHRKEVYADFHCSAFSTLVE